MHYSSVSGVATEYLSLKTRKKTGGLIPFYEYFYLVSYQ